MSKIVIIGAGAMGSAFALPCLDNNHDINVVGTHLENEFIDDLKKNDKQSEFLISEILFNINENENLNDKFNVINNSIKKNNFSRTALIFSISDTANKGGKLGWVKESILSKKIFNELKKSDCFLQRHDHEPDFR